jgi:hypothetical protein
MVKPSNPYISQRDLPVYAVFKKGGLFWATPTVSDEHDVYAAAAISYSLAHFDRDTLEYLLTIVQREIESIDTLRSIQDEIQDLQKGYSRWTTTVTLTNFGSHPVTFSGRAKILVDTRGAAGFSDRTVAILLEHRNDEREIMPVTVQGGEGTVVRFSSPALVRDRTDWKLLSRLFEEFGAGTIQLELTAKPLLWFQHDIVRSAVSPFSRGLVSKTSNSSGGLSS